MVKRRNRKALSGAAAKIPNPAPHALQPLPAETVSVLEKESPKSIWGRILLFLEHPWVTGSLCTIGGVAGALFYTPLLAACGIGILLAFHKVGVVRGQRRAVQIASYVGLFVVVFGTLYWVGIILKRTIHIPTAQDIAQEVVRMTPMSKSRTGESTIPPPSNQASPSKSFSTTIRTIAIYQEPSPMSLFMVGYTSSHGLTASPVTCLAYISIVNMQDVESTIESYSLAINKSGKWEELTPIPLNSTTVYMLGITNFGTGVLKMPHGFYRLNGPMTLTDMSHAAVMNPYPRLEEELRSPIRPHQTISGWVAYDTNTHPADRSLDGLFRVTLHDTSGFVFSDISRLESHKRALNDKELDTQSGLIGRVGPIAVTLPPQNVSLSELL